MPMIFSASLTLLCRVLWQEMVQAPYRDAAGQDAHNGVSVERVHNGGRDSCSSQFPQKVESLLSFFDGAFFGTQELGAAHPLHSSIVIS